MNNKALTFAAHLIIANVWIAGAVIVGGDKAQYMLGVGIGWLAIAVINKLTGK